MDYLYGSSPSSTSSYNTDDLYGFSNTDKKRKKKQKKNRNKCKQFIREEINIFNEKPHYEMNHYNNDLIPRNEDQKKLIDYLNDNTIPIVFITGAAGTGKTFISSYYAIKSLTDGVYNKIIITRPVVCTDEDIGFLPGNLNEKMDPWLRTIYDVFEKYVSKTYIEKLIKEGSIEICPLAFMRGRSFENSLILADEMQNSTPNQMKMILTRISFGSKLIINGDLEQSDNNRNGLKDFKIKYENYNNSKDDIKIINFKKKNIERHNVIKKVLDIYS